MAVLAMAIGSPAALSGPAQARVREAYARLPLDFEPNRGQADPGVRFLSRGSRHSLFLTSNEAVLQLRSAQNFGDSPMRIRFLGANPAARTLGIEELPGRSNYFIGHDPKNWRTAVPHYARVRFESVYPGVDLVYYGSRQQLEYDLVVAPGADPRLIRLAFDGVRKLWLDPAGDLVLETSLGQLRQHKPAVFQESAGHRRAIVGRYRLKGRREVVLALGAYDKSKPLVIDPALSYSTIAIGGTSVAVDSLGNTYVTGSTSFADVPMTPAAFQSAPRGGTCGTPPNTFPCRDVFVAKLNPSGTALVYSTYLGGNGDDLALGLAVDSAGNAYVAGYTTSTDFPTTPGALGASAGRGFVTKLNATGSALAYSTFFPATVWALALDLTGNAYLTGQTSSPDFPTTSGAFQTGLAGPTDAFVSKLNAAGTALVYSTFLGGPGFDAGTSIAVDSAGSAYVTGFADNRFPVTPGAFTSGDGTEFVAKLDSDGTKLLYSALLGGRLPLGLGLTSDELEGTTAIAVDKAGNAYLTGYTVSGSFPVTPGAFQGPPFSCGLCYRVFLTKLNAAGSALVYSSILGAGYGAAMGVDSEGNAWVAGVTPATNFPITPDALQKTFTGGTCVSGSALVPCQTGFLAKLNADATTLAYSTYLAGSIRDEPSGAALDPAGNISVTGFAGAGFFTTTGALQPASGNSSGRFALKLAGGAIPLANVSAASYDGPSLARESIVTAFGSGLAASTLVASSTPLPTSLGGTTVKLRDSSGHERLAPLFFVSPTQVNYQAPPDIASGPATVTVTGPDGSAPTAPVYIAALSPALFAANSDGRGVAAGLALRVKQDNSQSSEPLALFDPAQNKFVSRPIDLGPETDQVVLVLFGTGVRSRSSLSAVTARIGGRDAPVLYAGAQGQFVGLDQVNVRLPRNLAGSGETDVVLLVDGLAANVVRVNVR